MFGLPLTQEQFLSSVNDSKDFVRSYLQSTHPEIKYYALWNDYHNEVVVPYKRFRDMFSQYGFKFIDQIDFSTFTSEIEKQHVNIIYSHCYHADDEAIEFSDRLVFSDEFIRAFPLPCSKVIDLSVCNPAMIDTKLRAQRSHLVVKSVRKNIGLALWIYFYSHVFSCIIEKDLKYYGHALECAMNKIFNK